MILETLDQTQEFEYLKLTPEEQQSRGILGRLVGVIADLKNPTRNGRRYTEELWDKAFDNPIMQENIANRCLFGELGHPADRQETDMSKICICLAETPKKKDGKLWGVFDILNTPNGNILKAMCDYGCTIGVSSRGSGDLITGNDGQEEVDPNTFDLTCWDAVLLPAVKDARMKYVNESLDKKKDLNAFLAESLERIDIKDRNIVKESLSNIGIDLNEHLTEGVDIDGDIAVDNSEAVINELQEALKLNRILDAKVVALNEKLSVSYAKEIKLEEEVASLRSKVAKLSKVSKGKEALESKLESLEGTFSRKEIHLTEELQKTQEQRSALAERMDQESRRLNETINRKNATINELNEKLSKAKREVVSQTAMIESLQDQVETTKKTNDQLRENYSKKIEQSNQLIEKYKNVARETVNRYIDSRAKMLGVTANEIQNRLPKSYGFRDIDRVCESLRRYNVNINALPFGGKLNESVGVKAKTERPTIAPVNKEDSLSDFDLDLAKKLI